MSDIESDFEYEYCCSESESESESELEPESNHNINEEYVESVSVIVKNITIIKIDICKLCSLTLTECKIKKGFLYNEINVICSKNEKINVKYLDTDDNNSKNNSIIYLENNINNKTENINNIIKQIKELIENLNKVCMYCYKDLNKNITYFKPSICNSEFCKFRATTCTNYSNIEFELTHNKKSCELLIKLFNNLLKHVDNIQENDFNFYFCFDDIIKNYLNSNDTKTLLNILKKVKEIDLNNISNEITNRLIKWLIMTNPVIIEHTKSSNENLNDEYIIYSHNLEHEVDFQKFKEIYGSFYVYHGTNEKNWYTILKNGFIELSFSKKMVNGAIYGPGVYCSEDISVALTYSTQYSAQYHNDNFRNKDKIIAICEVINHPNLVKKHKDRSIVVVHHDKLITLRRLLFCKNASINFKYEHKEYKSIVSSNLYNIIETNKSNENENENNQCSICMDTNCDVIGTQCNNHYFHKECFINSIKEYSKCPVCMCFYVPLLGNQPAGVFTYKIIDTKLEGFSEYLTIQYNIEISNKQYERHITGYLPNNERGQKILQGFSIAFKNRVLLAIGTSITTGVKDTIVFNGIHLKTQLSGTYGYPDKTYLDRVSEELKNKGIII